MSEWKRGDVGYARWHETGKLHRVMIYVARPWGDKYACEGIGCNNKIATGTLHGRTPHSWLHFCLSCCTRKKPGENPSEKGA